MGTLTVAAKGQITLRQDILKHLGVRPGEKVTVDKLPGGRLEVRAARKGRISDLFGSLKDKVRKPLSIEEINRITTRGWAGKR